MKQFLVDPIQNTCSCLSPAQEEQAQLDSASDINTKEDQSHNNIDQHPPHASTTHRNRIGFHENEQKDMTTEQREAIHKCKDLLLSTMNSPN